MVSQEEVMVWSRDFSSYSVCNFFVEISTFKPYSWLLDETNLAKGQCEIYKPKYIFRKRHRDQVEKIIVDQLHLSKSFPQYKFKFISCQGICKKYVVMNNCNLRMRRCFKFQVQEFQNSPIETWIRNASFVKKNSIHSEDIDKIQTGFLRSVEYFHKEECTPPPLFPHLPNFIKLRSPSNTWTSQVMSLCGTIYNEICRFSNVQGICLELY